MNATHTPLVSVLIRSMDRATLQRALNSVAAQNYPNIETIVVAACGMAHRELPTACGPFPLRLVRPPQPLARAEAANAAMDAARGAWLNLLDDDDEFLPQHVSTLVDALTRQPDARLAYARSLSIADGSRSEFGAPYKFWRQLDTGFFHTQAALLARSLRDDGARFDARFDILEDMDFFVQCAQRTRFVFVDRITSVSHRDAGTSGTGTQRDAARVGAAIAQLRAKWAALERQLHATPEFRLEKTLWLLQHGAMNEAAAELRGVLAQRPQWADALAVHAQLAACGVNV